MMLSQRGFLVASMLCAAFACIAYLPGLPGAFVLDDIVNIVENPALHLQSLMPGAVIESATSPQPGSTTRFIPMLTFALDYVRGGGMDPGTFKVTNLVIHSLTTLVLAWFLRDLLRVAGVVHGRAQWVALAMALAWAIHPLQVSSVLYIVQRMQTLATLFCLLAMWAYLKGRQVQMEGSAGRTGWILAVFFWALAIGCKEDAVLLPAYLLAMELTVLRFRAADAGLARTLQRGYLLVTVLGAAVFLFVLAPYLWSWDAYAGRNFSSLERLLTQGRVLCLYLWQMLVPLPSHMPFYYDWLQPSRSLMQPWTTVPALLLLTGLLFLAWKVRQRRPLFSFGVLLFFAGHFVSSNLIPLELAFEHRNHLPLIGIVISVADLLMLASERVRFRVIYPVAVALTLLAALGSATVIRATSWKSAVSLAETSAKLRPQSVRAWNSLCVEWYELGGGPRADNPHLDEAIPACQRAAELAPHSVASLTNVLIYKSVQGTASEDDWNRYLHRLRNSANNGEHINSMWTMIGQARKGIVLNDDGLLATVDTIFARTQFDASDFAAVGLFILQHTEQPQRAYPYLEHAVTISGDRSFSKGLIGFLRNEGHTDWAAQLEAMIQEPD